MVAAKSNFFCGGRVTAATKKLVLAIFTIAGGLQKKKKTLCLAAAIVTITGSLQEKNTAFSGGRLTVAKKNICF